MPRISDQTVREVRDAASLPELVGDRIQLARRGGRWWGPCPFHDETAPSFCLLPDESRYYCFGCHESGDALDWVQQIEGAGDFAEAVEVLAERFGIEVKYAESSPQQEAQREAARRRGELLDRAASYYAEYLWKAGEAQPARDYLLGRGFDEELLRRFRIGYAPSSGTALLDRASEGGFHAQEMRDAGLASVRGGQLRDFFSSRITFPISDARGRVQGFGARTLDPNQRAKYVNSPEGPHFRKRHLLYGLDLARSSAARQGWVVVAEGYTDVMGMVAAGVEAAVACMGTALTTEQIRALRRSVGEVRVCFDGDQAGEQAAWRTAEAARGVPVALSAVQLPEGADPGDLGATESGRRQLKRAVETAEPLVTCLIRARAARAGASARERDRALGEITDLLRDLPDSVERDEAVRVATSELGLSRSLEERLRGALGEDGGREAARPARGPELSPRVALERQVLSLGIAASAEARANHLDTLSTEVFDEPLHRKLFVLVTSGAPVDDWPAEVAGLATALRAQADHEPSDPELQEAVFRLQLDELQRRISAARSEGDEPGLLEALQLQSELRGRLRGDR
ncbi:MAG: DNA primase [Thermoleophilia bacterium]|nr:DNA primase [Thermoleophilia bacterium]MDH3725220.1 DNA primase [Thermoleophilia bacterium]